METFSVLLALSEGNPLATGGFLTRASHAELPAPEPNSWVNNRDTGDSRRHRAHYDVTVMHCMYIYECFQLANITFLSHAQLNERRIEAIEYGVIECKHDTRFLYPPVHNTKNL